MQAYDISSNIFDKCKDLLENDQTIIIKTKYLIYPENQFKIVWMVFVLVLFIYCALYSPYAICFNIDQSNQFDFVLGKCIDFLFFIDILVNINSAYEDKEGNLVDNRKKIFKTYFK